MGTTIKLSRFAHFFVNERLGTIALFHAIGITPVFLGLEALGLLERLGEGVDTSTLNTLELDFATQLQGLDFVVEGDKEENNLDEITSKFKPRLTTMYLILTDQCNLGCKYCFVEAGFPEDYKTATMNWEVAQAALDTFIAQRDPGNEGQVWLYGGEPLLNTEVLYKCLDYLAIHDPEVGAVMVTNGTLVTDEIATKLATYPKLQIAVSLDGPQEVHDQKRTTKKGGGSYTDTVRGIRILQDAGIGVGISCTLADHNVDRVVEIADWMKDALSIKSIGMNLLVDTPRAFVEEEYVTKATQGLIDLFQVSRVEGIYEDRIMRKVTAFAANEPHWHDCAGCGSQFVISPEGRIGICHEGLGERKFFMGSILDPGYSFSDSPLAQEWAKRSPASMPDCLDCTALGICGGGCPYGAMLKYGSIWEVDQRFCGHSKQTLEWLIWDLYDKVAARNPA